MARPSTGSEVGIFNERMIAEHASKEMPNIASLNVKSSKVHIGPKIVTVSQTVQNNEMVKGQILGLELVSVKSTKRLSCSVAIFLCWALVVALGLAVYLFYFVLYKQQVRLDIDLPLRLFLWSTLKNTSRAERFACVAAVSLLLTFITLTVYYTVYAKSSLPAVVDVAPHEWRIDREMWLAREYKSNSSPEAYAPLKLVIVQHTVSPECHTFKLCAAEMRNLQNYFLNTKGYDIPYSFLIGNDGRVYEGRGWNIEGAHTYGYNRCSVGIGFVGDYREEQPVFTHVSTMQMNRTKILLEEGVKKGFLVPDYFVVGAKDISSTVSPGSHLYKALQSWDHYDHQHQFANKNCDEIYGRV